METCKVEYDIAQALDLAELAVESLEKAPSSGARRARNALYLSHLAIEIALKAGLEKAGMDVSQIRKMGHNLKSLSKELGTCSFEYALGVGRCTLMRDITVTKDSGYLSFGYFIEASQWDSISKYPGQLRYGPDVTHFDPEMVAALAKKVCVWITQRIASLKKTT